MHNYKYKIFGYLIFSVTCLFLIKEPFSKENNKNEFLERKWAGDLQQIDKIFWNESTVIHLLERAGFGGNQKLINKMLKLSPTEAVNYMVDYEHQEDIYNEAFSESGIYDESLNHFPPSRPATTKLAKDTGKALGISVKPEGNRALQPIVNKFFYWLRASRLETKRVAYWWANKMLNTNRPLEEKMTLFWHNHFSTSETKVRDYRKLLLQNQTLRKNATSDFKTILISIAQDPAMLSFLDAGKNVKGAPNENFAREIMELFSMGVGNYSEKDIREAARAFTGWNSENLKFIVLKDLHDKDEKTFLSKTGKFNGLEIIDIILEQPITARFLVTKLYKEFVREELDPLVVEKLSNEFFLSDYKLKPLLKRIFLSRDFYSVESMGTHVKSPVELVINSYKKLGLKEIPGIPDFNESTSNMGQELFFPPTVAGWAGGKSWITPGLLMERGNFIYSTLFPDVGFIPGDRFAPDPKVRIMHNALAEGKDVTTATQATQGGNNMMAESNMMADRDEDFNTRLGIYRGWQMAIEKVKPIPRSTPQINLTKMILDANIDSSEEAVDFLIKKFLSVPVDAETRLKLISFFTYEIGTEKISEATTYMEHSLRVLLHIILSQPEYQLG